VDIVSAGTRQSGSYELVTDLDLGSKPGCRGSVSWPQLTQALRPAHDPGGLHSGRVFQVMNSRSTPRPALQLGGRPAGGQLSLMVRRFAFTHRPSPDPRCQRGGADFWVVRSRQKPSGWDEAVCIGVATAPIVAEKHLFGGTPLRGRSRAIRQDGNQAPKRSRRRSIPARSTAFTGWPMSDGGAPRRAFCRSGNPAAWVAGLPPA